MPYTIYILAASDISVSGGQQLSGITQGDGSHLVDETITLNSRDWQAVTIDDNDAFFSDNDRSQSLDGRQTIDGVDYASGTVVEAEFGLTLTDGTNTYPVVTFNVTNSSPAFSTVEGLAFIGPPGGFPPANVALRVTAAREGPSFAAADYTVPLCFTPGTLIETPCGVRPVETLSPGALVCTRDHGVQPLRWVGRRRMAGEGAASPVRFAPGALGNDRALIVSPQHRMLVCDWRAQMLFAETAVLVPAIAFAEAGLATRVRGGQVEYIHLLLDRHAVLRSNGAWSESFQPGPRALGGVDSSSLKALTARCRSIATDPRAYGPAAHRDLRGREARALLAA